MSLYDELSGAFSELASSQLGFATYVTDSDGQRVTTTEGDPLIVLTSGVPAIPVRTDPSWRLEEGGARDTDSRAWTVTGAGAGQFHEGQWVTDGTWSGHIQRIDNDPENFLATITAEQR